MLGTGPALAVRPGGYARDDRSALVGGRNITRIAAGHTGGEVVRGAALPSDNGSMRWFRRQAAPARAGSAGGAGFGAWLLAQFAGEEALATMPFARLERVCSNAASLVCGAAYARPDAFRRPGILRPALREEAGLVARRTADGFKAALADRENTVLAWPWEHMGTSLAWQATRAGELDGASLGERVEELAGAYALFCREQLAAVLDLWRQVAAGVYRGEREPDLPAMGAEMLAAFEAGTAGTPGRG